MTRLTEALERARTAVTHDGAPRLVPKPADRRSGEGASAWQFDEESPDAADDRAASVDVPKTWEIDGLLPGVDAPAAAPAAAPVVAASAVATMEPSAPVNPIPDDIRRPAEPQPSVVDLDLEWMDIKLSDIDKLAVGGRAEPGVVEQYRSLAAAVHHSQLQYNTQVLMISSALEGEGKTLTSTNLALTLSHSYQRRVLLIDADLRRPSVHSLLQLDNRVGLGDTLKQGLPNGALPVQRLLPTLWVMTAGQPNPDPMGALVSEAMKQFLADASEQFDWVLIDTPPVALLPDANLLAAMVDTALLVVSAGTTPHSLVTRAIDAIGRSKILGVVLNRADPEITMGYDHLSYAYGQPKPTRQPRFGL